MNENSPKPVTEPLLVMFAPVVTPTIPWKNVPLFCHVVPGSSWIQPPLRTWEPLLRPLRIRMTQALPSSALLLRFTLPAKSSDPVFSTPPLRFVDPLMVSVPPFCTTPPFWLNPFEIVAVPSLTKVAEVLNPFGIVHVAPAWFVSVAGPFVLKPLGKSARPKLS